MPPKAKPTAKQGAKSAAAKPKSKMGGPPQINIAQIRKLQEAQKAQAQLEAKRREQEKKRELEAKKREEEMRAQIEREAAEKLAEMERKKLLRKTRKERDEKRKLEAAKQALLATGIVEVAALAEGQTEGQEPKKVVYTDARKKKRRERKKKEEEEGKGEGEGTESKGLTSQPEGSAAGGEEEEVTWEDFLDDEEKKAKAAEEAAEGGDDEDDDEEEEESELDMDDDAILERHHKRMVKRITETIMKISSGAADSSSSSSTFPALSEGETTSLAIPASTASSSSSSVPSDSSVTFPLRSPVVCILGHVDVGKTKILDKLRQTNVQVGEAGGITQQIGATFFPIANIEHVVRQTAKQIPPSNYDRVPGLLIIDTPGHESFTNLRSRGSSMCNVAILVVDIMHSLEQQTLESLNLILQRNVPFVIALNKIDVVTGWKPVEKKDGESEVDRSFVNAYNSQTEQVQGFFDDRLQKVINDLAHQSVNAALYTDTTKDWNDYVRIIPTSARTGEGLPDLLANLLSIGQMELSEELRLKPELSATVMEVKTITGLGTTVDVILANGTLSEGDTIIVCGSEGAIVSQVRALLTPHPMKEIRVKTEYISHKNIMAAIGVKICAQGLEQALAGSSVYVAYDEEEIEVLEDKVEDELVSILGSFDKQDTGTYVVASTVGSLEALVTYLTSVTPPVPIAGVSVGPVHRKDVMKAAVMVEKNPKFAVILAFDVPIDEDAEEEAEKQGVTIFSANIIYHLTKRFNDYLDDLKREEAEAKKKSCIYPAKMRILQCFHESDPLILGVRVEVGKLRVGVPLIGLIFEKQQPKKDEKGKPIAGSASETQKARLIEIGIVESIERDKSSLKGADEGAEVAIKVGRGAHAIPTFGRQFDSQTVLVTKFDRASIDYLKEYEHKELKDNLALMKFIAEMKGPLGIMGPTGR